MRAILKIKLTVFLMTILLVSESNAQNGWTIQNSGTTKNLKSVHFVNSNIGFTVGDSGTILKTTNGGKNWIARNSSTAENLNDVYFLNIKRGYIAGENGTYLTSIDSGNTWTKIIIEVQNDITFNTKLPITNSFNAVHFINAYFGFIVGDSLILSTFDGGNNWESNYLSNSLLSICFPSAETGYAIDNQGGIYSSTDGGMTWTGQQISPNNSPNSVYFTGVQTGYITGASPNNLIKTSDGGNNWTVVHSGANNLRSVMFSDSIKGISVGENGAIYKTSTGGNSWDIQYSGTTETLNSVYLRDSLRGAAVGNNGTILTTVTGGELPNFKLISGTVKFADNNTIVTHGYVKAIKYDTTTSQILTIDSGRITPNGEYLIKVPYGDSTDIMAYQDDELDCVPTYYPSTTNWQDAVTIYPNVNRSNIDIKVFRLDTSSTSVGYAAGYVYKNIFRLEDEHLPGSVIYAKDGNKFKGVAIADSLGRYKINLPIGNFKIHVNRYGYKSDSTIIQLQHPNIIKDTLNFYLEKHTSSITSNENIPLNFFLEQNYPNPFNPETSIEYSIGRSSFVRLAIYDLRGRLIRILENDDKTAGKHSVQFTAGQLPSGVYFYKLETEFFTASRTMILLK
ncbi:MAG TPA: YCF48-related protein [Ignavibacteria bacterium]|nr:YCF48-related protein [Ignavibacteria bacterium]